MKYIGMILLISCTTLMGINAYSNIGYKLKIYEQLSLLCELLIIDFNSKMTPVVELMDNILVSERFNKLSFITSDYIREKGQVKSILSDEENEDISNFLYSLGKNDAKTQIKIIKSFKELVECNKKDYKNEYIKYKKLYLCMGFLGGIFVAIVFA